MGASVGFMGLSYQGSIRLKLAMVCFTSVKTWVLSFFLFFEIDLSLLLVSGNYGGS